MAGGGDGHHGNQRPSPEESTEDIFEQPICLIGSDNNGHLVTNESALCQLELIQKPLNVVAIAGIYRTGKSYLMNRLAGKNRGFPLGSTIQSKTKGIWGWCRPHPVHPHQALLLLDTEGLGDVNKGNIDHDNWIFSLATLLSSTLIYNVLGVLDQGTVEKLNFVSVISKHIRTSKSEKIDVECRYFPTFVVTLRDFTLELQRNGREITPDEYLEDALRIREETDEKTKRFNEPRRCIRRYFKQRKCFVFDRPGKAKTLHNLENLTDNDLDQDFVKDVGQFCEYIFNHCGCKLLDTGAEINGSMFASLVRSYVDDIRGGMIPCIETSFGKLTDSGNHLETSVRRYSETMEIRLKSLLPTHTEQELDAVHQEVADDALRHFRKKTGLTNSDMEGKLSKKIKSLYGDWKKRNEKASTEKTRDVLNNLYHIIAERIQQRTYRRVSGYGMYQQDIRQLQAKFGQVKGLGVKAKETYDDFMDQIWPEGQKILEFERTLT